MSELSFGEVGEILQLVKAIEGSEIDLQWGDLRIQVRRGAASSPREGELNRQEATNAGGGGDLYVQPTSSPASAPSATTTTLNASEEVVGGAGATPSHWVAVSAPMAGTLYRVPSPDEPPFVEVGDPVSDGDTVAIIEVMKLFTELKAAVSGKVVRIDVPDSTLVEFGQALVWIEPA